MDSEQQIGTALEPTKQLSLVDKALSDQEVAIMELWDAIGVLKRRLKPVTSAEPPVTEKAATDQSPQSSGVASTIKYRTTGIKNARAAITDIIGRLEV